MGSGKGEVKDRVIARDRRKVMGDIGEKEKTKTCDVPRAMKNKEIILSPACGGELERGC